MRTVCKILPVVFLFLSSFCLSQENKRGTIKVKKPIEPARPKIDSASIRLIDLIDGGQVAAVTEQMPGFPAGNQNMYAFIKKNLIYPHGEMNDGIEGTVYVRFVVLKDGTLSEIGILKGIPVGPGLEQEAIRIVKKMPKWVPGKENGEFVPVEVHLPVKFEL